MISHTAASSQLLKQKKLDLVDQALSYYFRLKFVCEFVRYLCKPAVRTAALRCKAWADTRGEAATCPAC